MRGGLPESTGLPGSGLSRRRQEQVAWLRQAGGVLRAAMRARLGAPVLLSRASRFLGAQALLAALAAWAIHQAGWASLPLEAGPVIATLAMLLLVIHAIARLAGVVTDALRDLDEQALDAYEATPLPSSAYVAGRTAFHLVEQGLGLVLLLPAFGLAHALRGIDLRSLAALALALLAVSLTYCLGSLSRVLRVHGRRSPGGALPPNLRPGSGYLIVLALVGGAFAMGTLVDYQMGTLELAPLLLALSLTPAVPILSSTGFDVQVFETPVPLWLASSGLLLALAPFFWSTVCLRWKPPMRASGAGLRLGFALAWFAMVLVLSGTLRHGLAPTTVALLLVAGVGAVLPAAWAGGSELAAIGERSGVEPRGVLSQRRSTAGLWALLLQAAVLGLMALLAPTAVAPRSLWFLLALLTFLATLPTVLVAAGLARCLGPTWFTTPCVVGLAGFLGAFLAGLPSVLAALASVPGLGGAAEALAGPAALLASSSPFSVLPEAAGWVFPAVHLRDWVSVPAPWNLGLPDWACGSLVGAALGLPAAWWLARHARRKGR